MSTAILPEVREGYFPRWKLKTTGVIMPEERLPWGQTIVSGLQHGVAMAGGTIIGPLLMGFDPNLALLFSGIGTLIFFAVVAGRVPSYLGSSFSFIAVVIAASGYSGHGPNPNLDVALGGIIAAGVLYGIIALIVMQSGVGWIERLMPPIVTGAVVAAIGLNLAPLAVKSVSGSQFDVWIGLVTVLIVGLTTVDSGAAVARWRGKKWRQLHPPTHIEYPTWSGLAKGLEKLGLRVLSHRYVGYYRALESYLKALGLERLVRPFSRLRTVAIPLDVRDIQLVIARKAPGRPSDS